MIFDRIKENEKEQVLNLYRSVLGTEYCVWTEDYPGEREIAFDLSRDALFGIWDGEKLAGVISIDDDPEVEKLTCWSKTMVPSAELARVGVALEYQNKGIARRLLAEVMLVAKERGYQGVHLLVAKENVKALRSYGKLEFENVGECYMFGHEYWCYEKAL